MLGHRPDGAARAARASRLSQCGPGPGGVGKITFCQEINDELWQQNHVKVTGAEEDDDDLDSHEPLMLSKLSALLCLLDGRKAVTLDDWALAKIMYATSQGGHG